MSLPTRAHTARPTRSKRSTIRLLAGAAVIAVTLSVSACSGGLAGANTSKSLVVLNWKGYGSDQPWATAEFEKETGANVVHRYVSSETEMIELLRQSKGSIDVALPNFQFIGPAIRAGLIQPLDTSKLENFKDVYPQLLKIGEPAITSNGKTYGIPWVWGYSAIFYNKNTITTPPTTVADLWDPKYKGKVGLADDPTLNVLLAALYLHEDPAHPDLQKVTTALEALKANAGLITASTDELAKALASKTIEIGITASSTVGSLTGQGLPVAITIPHEGGIGWGDNWTIATGTTKKDLAYKWINFMTSKSFETKWASDPNGGSSAPANQNAGDSLSQAAHDRVGENPEVLDKLALQGPLPEEQLNAWINVWETVKAH